MADGSTPTKARQIRAADLFCGAGGTSTGAARAARSIGAQLTLTAVNHWPVALETHAAMHPTANHICADLESVRPREVVPEGRLDLLMASPTCTYHSRARGGRPVNDQQRMDPWHVHRWCCELRVARLLVENVPEFVDWGPCSLVTGRPIESRRGEYFRAWCDALRAVGFRLEWRVLNCADYGDPTTRQRFFLIGRSDGKPLRWPEPTHARRGSVDLLGMRAPWRSAAECIDWAHPGKSIFGRKKPLKPNTLRRLLAGAVKYNWPRPHIDALQALLDGREPVLTVPAADLGAAFLVQFRGTGEAIGRSARDCGDPVPTVTAGGRHVGLVMATASGGAARDLSEPLPTVVGGGHGARPHFVEAVIVSKHGGPNNTARGTNEPMYTVSTGGGGAIALPLIAPYYGGGSGLTAKSAAEPLASVTTKARFGLAEPFIMPITHSGSARSHSVDAPLPTITTAHRGELALIQPAAAPMLLRAAHGDSDGRDPASRVLDPAMPMPTLTGTNEVSYAAAVATECRIDILYRMLTPRELARAMSFDVDGAEYPFAGNATEITKQIGNAVPCRTAEALVRALL